MCRARSRVVFAVNGDVCARCQDGEVAANDQRVRQVGNGLDKKKKEGSGKAGDEHRKRDGTEDCPRGRTQGGGGLFHRRVKVLEHSEHIHVCNGEEGKGQNQGQT